MADLHSISRRRLLTAMALSPLLWYLRSARAETVNPHRIVALEWLPVELLLALGITPYGVADVHNYNIWVNEPSLPASVIDVGLRTEPNLELLTQMKPSLLVWSAGYGPDEAKLAKIAPGRGFTFSDGKQPLALARRSLNEMAQMLNLEVAAKKHLDQFDALIDGVKPHFARRGDRPLLMITLLDPRHVLVFAAAVWLTWSNLNVALPCAQWGQAFCAPDINLIDQILFHYSLLPRLRSMNTPTMDAGDNVATERQQVQWFVLGGLVVLLLAMWAALAFGRDAQGWHWARGTLLQELLPWRWPRIIAALTAGDGAQYRLHYVADDVAGQRGSAYGCDPDVDFRQYL